MGRGPGRKKIDDSDLENIRTFIDKCQSSDWRYKRRDNDYEKEFDKCKEECGVKSRTELAEFYKNWMNTYRDVLRNWELVEVTDIREFDKYETIDE